MTYQPIRNANQRIDFDRSTWAQDTQTVFRMEISGRGAKQLEPVNFGLPYQGPPFFAWGVELAPDETLTPGDFPFVSAGVAEWKTNVVSEEILEPRYLGATIFVNIATRREYDLIFNFIFEGVAYQNPQFTAKV